MHISSQRLLLTALAATAIAFLAAGLIGNDHTGVRGTAGGVAWIAFLIGLLVTVVLAAALLTQSALRRRRASQ
jgi:membrane associated rhomboid family serine protease